ncbi:hypothetical protein ACQCLI_18270 [Pseudomonas nitroreducens]|uniref:hypothetical protein n=1 Tax=Pseudomonas nitroreducens TaxID=46680 RepID=UPI0012FDC52C|nr:hypothetical protein [Pseudomonas nitroreducens]
MNNRSKFHFREAHAAIRRARQFKLSGCRSFFERAVHEACMHRANAIHAMGE